MKPYIQAVLLLHHAKREVNETTLAAVVRATGLEPDPTLVSVALESVKGVDLNLVLAKVDAEEAVARAQSPPIPEPMQPKAEEPKKPAEDPQMGLDKLFGE